MSTEMTPGAPCPPPQDPRVVSNPPGLPAISYRVDDFTGFRRALLRPLPGEQAISTWRPRPGDLGLQILEWWAYLADVLTFYNERYANEAYLRTATEQASITNMVALLAYQPAPGIAATGMLAVVRNASHPKEALVIPARMGLSSTATPGVPAQTFEVDARRHFHGVSNVPVTVPPDPTLHCDKHGLPQEVLLAGRISKVKQGDDLVLVVSGFAGFDDNWSAVRVTGITRATDPATGAINTDIGLDTPGWGPTQRLAVPPVNPKATDYRLLRPTAATTVWSNRHVPFGSHVIGPAPGEEHLTRVHLSGSVRDISPGDIVFFQTPPNALQTPSNALQTQPDALALGVVIRTSERFWPVPYPGQEPATGTDTPSGPIGTPSGPIGTPSGPIGTPSGPTGTPSGFIQAPVVWAEARSGAIGTPSGPIDTPSGTIHRLPDIPIAHTVLDLQFASPDSRSLTDVTSPGDLAGIAVRYALRDVGTIIGFPKSHLTSFDEPVEAAYRPRVPGQPALLQDKNGAGVLVGLHSRGENMVAFTDLTDATKNPAPMEPLPVPLQILVDLVPVSRGTTVTGEVLGSGDAAVARQSFTLAKSPLTYLASGAGWTSTLRVFVNQIEWREVPAFFGQPSTAQVFMVTRSPDQSVTTVTFGDGVTGARLPSGTGNVTATYRYGSGKVSPPAGRLNIISAPQVNLAAIQNPVAVSGGADPEAPDDVRAGAPVTAATFGRAISATDYENIAARAPGVSRAAAYWEFDATEQRTLVTVYVGDDSAAVAAATAALAGSEDPHRPVKPVMATPILLSLACTLRLAPGYQAGTAVAAATAALSGPVGLFSPSRMGIGQRLYRSALDAALMVPGVAGVEDLTVTGHPRGDLGEVLNPGRGAYFTLQLQPGSIGVEG